VTTLVASSVSATNLKEVVLTFNNELDATLAADVANYSVKVLTTEKGVAKATLSTDKKTVILTLTAALAQQDAFTVTAKKALGLTADQILTGAAMDVAIPVIETVALTGPNTFDVKFSEPVQADITAAVLVNNGIYGVTSQVLSTDARTLTVTLSAGSLTAGDYTVKVSGYKDFANYMAQAKTFTLTYVVNKAAPVVSLTSATQTTVKVKFDKAVTLKGGAALNANYFYQTYSAWKPYTVTTTDNKTFTLSFKDAVDATIDPILPVGSTTVTVLKSVSDVVVVDAWGNEMAADAKLVATVAADTVAPMVTKVEASAENAIDVTFSEDVATLTADMFSIKDKDAKAVTAVITSIDYDADTYTATLNLSSKLTGGNYTVEVKNAVDKSFSANKMITVTNAFAVTDLTAMDLSTVTTALVNNSALSVQYIYVTFPEAVSQAIALNKTNYLVNNVALAAADKVEMFGADGKKVRITVAYRGTTPAAYVTAGMQLTMGRIADLAGNLPVMLSTPVAISADATITAFTAKALDLNKFALTFVGELKTVPADSITTKWSTGTAYTVASVNSVVYSSTTGKTTVTVTANANAVLPAKTSALGSLVIAVVPSKIETITGNLLGTIANATTLTDGIKPALVATTPLVQTAANVVTLTFDETMATINPGLAASDLVIVDNEGTTLVAGVDYNVGANASTLVVTLSGSNYAGYDGVLTVSTKTAVTYIVDGSSNTAVGFTGKTVTMNTTAIVAVQTAEVSNLQADVDAAQILVTALTSGTAKTALQARIDAVQAIIAAL
jgi:methionine-rich copper-binding protein CopC